MKLIAEMKDQYIDHFEGADDKYDKARKEYFSAYGTAVKKAKELLRKQQISEEELTQYKNLAQKAEDAQEQCIQNIKRRYEEVEFKKINANIDFYSLRVIENAFDYGAFDHEYVEHNLDMLKNSFKKNIKMQKASGYTQWHITNNVEWYITELRDKTKDVPDSKEYINNLQKEMEEYINNDNNDNNNNNDNNDNNN